MVLAEMLESEVPRQIILGKEIHEELTDLVRKIQADIESRVTWHVFFGPKTESVFKREINASLEEITSQIEIYTIRDSLAPELDMLHEEICSNISSTDVLIAVGGGKVIDSVKYLVSLQQKTTEMRIEYLNVPTLTSHDGIISPYIFLYPENETGEKFYGEIHPPLAVIVDLQHLQEYEQLPRHLAASVGDTLAKLTAIWDWKFANRIKGEPFSEFASGIISHAYDLLKSQILMPTIETNYENLISTAVKALLISGVVTCTAGNIRTSFGAEHLFAIALDDLVPRTLLHGERCAIGTIIMAYLQDQPWESYKNILERVGLSTTLEEYHIDSELLVEALCSAHLQQPQMYTILGENGISKKAARNLLHETGLIL